MLSLLLCVFGVMSVVYMVLLFDLCVCVHIGALLCVWCVFVVLLCLYTLLDVLLLGVLLSV